MLRIDNLSTEGKQMTRVVLPSGGDMTLTLSYRAAAQRWTMDVSADGFEVQGVDMCIHPNILRPWKNLIKFGLAISAVDGVDPVYVDDFGNDRVQLYVLTEADVQEIETVLMGARA